MSASERKQRERAAAIMLAQAGAYEHQAAHAATSAESLRLRGRALQMRGSAWVMQSEVMEDTDG